MHATRKHKHLLLLLLLLLHSITNREISLTPKVLLQKLNLTTNTLTTMARRNIKTTQKRKIFRKNVDLEKS
jgi:hypothetical protein